MREHSEELAGALKSGFDVTYSADLIYDNQRVIEDIPLEDVELSWDGSAAIEGSGSAVIIWTDPLGVSLRPGTAGDWLSPFGSRLRLYVTISVGSVFRERVPLGDYDITEVPEAEDARITARGVSYVTSSRVRVELKDRMWEVERDRFIQLSSPQAGLSVYEEIQRITGLQIRRTVANATITRQVVYEVDRVKAVQELADILGQVAYMDSDGVLTFRSPDPALTPAARLEVGANGTVTALGSSLTAEGVYNGVIIRGETQGDTAPILAERWVASGPLRATLPGEPRTPYHRVPRFYSSPQITTQAQADAIIDSLLARWSVPTAAQLEVQCIYDPRIQVGDTVEVFDGEHTWLIHVQEVRLGMAATMGVTGDVVSRE